ncbi:MAG: hypothetical protein KatS3mg038_1563 [Candidatus Kapaibacterium sp.]|nr:MAG: hypothetical protein KatS3mg038_1563 [Candidatus Kapabacteria bacterium]
MSERIEAPAKVVELLRRGEEMIQKIQSEMQAILAGAAAALDVPDGWRWDGSGWAKVELEERKSEEQ